MIPNKEIWDLTINKYGTKKYNTEGIGKECGN